MLQPLFHPIVGLALGPRAVVTPADLAVAALGRPVWGPASLLADLGLRLGLPEPPMDSFARLTHYRSALSNAELGVFDASFRADAWGTTRLVMSMRDALVEAGWKLSAISGSGCLEALARLPAPLPGRAERLCDVTAALSDLNAPPYEALTLCEPREEWPPQWRALFAALERLGARIDVMPPAQPSAPSDTDLGVIQRLLAGDSTPSSLRGDGTLRFVTAPTVEPLADGLAAYVAATGAGDAESRRPSIVVVRTLDPAPLEAALSTHGLPRLGMGSPASPPTAAAWLPLILRLARAPFDPEAAIDLLLLGEHGLSRFHTDRLASALAEGPGLASSSLRRVTPEVEASAPEAFARMRGWLTPIDGPSDPATWSVRLRALDELLRERARGAGVPGVDAANEALELARVTLDGVLRALPGDEVPPPALLDELIALLSDQTAVALSRREAGALLGADAPGALLATVDHVVWWGFVAPPRPPRLFRDSEIAALAAAGIEVPDPIVALRAEARAARAAIMRARRSVVLAAPERLAGEALATHPLWSELIGRTGAMTSDLRRLMRTVSELTTPTAIVAPRALPPVTHLWHMTPPPRGESAARGASRLSAGALERWLLCPLSQVLQVEARMRRRARGPLEGGPALLGRVGHALVETLHHQGALAAPTPEVIAKALDKVLVDEAAYLLRPARAAVVRHLTRTLTVAVQRLAVVLADQGLVVTGVEEEASLELAGRPVTLRTDLRARDGDGQVIVIDLKWSTRSHRAALAQGRAIQLSAYVQALADAAAQSSGPAVVGAWYFGFMRADRSALATRESLGDTWRRVAHSFAAVEAALADGRVPVGLPGAPSLREALGLPSDRALPTEGAEPCRYCVYDLVCGKAFQA